MELALQTPQQSWDLGALRELWAAADALGYVAAYTHDHLVPLHPGERPGSRHTGSRSGPQLDGWLVAGALAAVTTRLRVGVLASGVTYRPPGLLAKLAVTLDHLTDGRAVLGVGAGWHAEEHHAYGLPFPPAADRIERLEETLAAFRALCTSAGEPVTFRGSHVVLKEAVFDPGPVSPEGVPVLVGGSSPGVLTVAARHADLLNAFAAPSEWPALHDRIDAALRGAGRQPGDLARSAFVGADLTGDTTRAADLVERTAVTRGIDPAEARRRVLAGDDDQLADVLAAHRAARLQTLVVSPQPGAGPAQLERLMTIHRLA